MVSAPGLALAAEIASRNEQSALHKPSLVSAVLVTVKAAASTLCGPIAANNNKTIVSAVEPRTALFLKNLHVRFFITSSSDNTSGFSTALSAVLNGQA
jgi:hypothetical protein